MAKNIEVTAREVLEYLYRIQKDGAYYEINGPILGNVHIIV